MSLKLTIREIQKSYSAFKTIARERLVANDVEGTITYINHCVTLAQQFNWIYADDELEQIEQWIGEMLLPERDVVYTANPNRVVFYDDFCVTFILAVQYLEALLKAGKEVLYITTTPIQNDAQRNFFQHIESLKGLHILHIDAPNASKTINQAYKATVDFRPAQVLLHISARSIFVPVMYRIPKGITRYLINLQDQTFWLGKNAIDYCVEFRPFGVAVSRERRGIKPEQQLMLPFYPVKDNNPFDGFPKEADGHVTIFSGGDLYKTLDTKRVYWKLIKRILDKHPDVRFLFATKANPLGNKAVEKFVRENHYEDKFIYVGFRKDIYEVFAHIDIFMGTCPVCGSLMSQLSAINAKPILQYYYPGTPDDETEQAICINDTFPISFQDEEAFLQEADWLITDAKYRKSQGERLKKAMITKEQFDYALAQIINTNTSPYPCEPNEVDYSLLDERWYELERCGFTDTMAYVYSILGKKNVLKYVPTMYIKKQIRTIMNKLHI